MASALNVAVLALQGNELREDIFTGQYGNAIYIPIPFVDNNNLADNVAASEGQPGYWSVTEVVTPEEAQEFFQ
jgi:ribose transport system substrate-binding protein